MIIKMISKTLFALIMILLIQFFIKTHFIVDKNVVVDNSQTEEQSSIEVDPSLYVERTEKEITDEIVTSCSSIKLESNRQELDFIYMHCLDKCLSDVECREVASEYCKSKISEIEDRLRKVYISCILLKKK